MPAGWEISTTPKDDTGVTPLGIRNGDLSRGSVR